MKNELIMKRIFSILATALVLISCGGNARKKTTADTAQVPDMHTAEIALDYTGTYRGTFPAADCPGIEMTLTLRPDGTFAEHGKYIDRDAEFDRQGRYAVSGNLLTLTDDKGEAAVRYKVEEHRLRRLGDDGQVVAGTLAEKYTLTKTTE